MASTDSGAADGGVILPATASTTSVEATIPGTEATPPADGWYYLLDGQHLGPFTTEQLIGATRSSRENSPSPNGLTRSQLCALCMAPSELG